MLQTALLSYRSLGFSALGILWSSTPNRMPSSWQEKGTRGCCGIPVNGAGCWTGAAYNGTCGLSGYSHGKIPVPKIMFVTLTKNTKYNPLVRPPPLYTHTNTHTQTPQLGALSTVFNLSVGQCSSPLCHTKYFMGVFFNYQKHVLTSVCGVSCLNAQYLTCFPRSWSHILAKALRCNLLVGGFPLYKFWPPI